MSARARFAREDGMSIVVVVVTLGLLIVLSGVTLQMAVRALGMSGHQASVKRALHAADAAIDAAIFRLNRADLGGALDIDPLDPANLPTQTCVVSTGQVGGIDLTPLPVGSPPDPSGRRWCPATDGELTDSGASFRYRVSELVRVGAGQCGTTQTISLDREIVATGTSGGVTRRVKARMRAKIPLLSGAAVQSASSTSPMRMNGASRVLGIVQSNGNIIGAGANVVSGNALPGPGFTATGVVAASTAPACQPFSLPSVDAAAAAAATDVPSTTQRCVSAAFVESSICSVPLLGLQGGSEWNLAQRTLRVWGTGIVTLTGSNYRFCSIRLEGSAILKIPSSVPVSRLFLSDPASCGAGGGQITADGQSRIVNCHLQTQANTLQLYALGSATAATTQTLSGGPQLSASAMSALCGLNVSLVGTPMTVYAPRSTVELGGSTAISGVVAANVVNMAGASAVQPVDTLINLNELGASPVLPLYKPTDYVECVGRSKTFENLPAADPSQGC